MESIVIVGAGQAGGWTAKTLRDQQFTGKIVLVGNEAHPPYERPPLSKGVLLGNRNPESTYLWSVDALKGLDIDLKLGRQAMTIDRQNKSVILSDGITLTYDRLMLATGSRVRILNTPGAHLPRIYYLRDINDAIAISKFLVPGSRLLVVGGGWIGLEIAAAARQKQVRVMLIEATAQLCSRALPAYFAQCLQTQHERHGVDILLNATVMRFRGTDHFESAELSCGEKIVADAAVIGIGVLPNSEMAHHTGLATDNGIMVDASGRTSDESIYAAGDVANQPSGTGRRVRLESWSNAQNQAIAVAKAMLDKESLYRDIPYFWSDQYDIKLQILGSFSEQSDVITRGSKLEGSTSFFLKDNKIAAVISFNRPQDIAIARRLMQRNLTVDRQTLASAHNLNEILRAA